MLWCCIDMRFVDEPLENPMFNRGAWRLLNFATPFGCDPYPSSLRVPGRPQKSPGGEFRVSPRYLLCGVSLPGGATIRVGVDERVEGASGRPTGFVLLDVDQVEQAASVRPLVEPHRSVASFDDLNQASDEVEAVRTVIPLAANSVDLHGGWLVHTFLLGAKVRLGRRGESPSRTPRLPRP